MAIRSTTLQCFSSFGVKKLSDKFLLLTLLAQVGSVLAGCFAYSFELPVNVWPNE